MKGTFLEIDLKKIRENAQRVVERCGQHKIEVLGVTKGFSAMPDIVQAMLDGGISKLADARLENITQLRERGFTQEITLLRIPMISQAEEVVRLADCSLNSELATMEALSDAAVRQGKIHRVILMIELGDLREGMFPADALRTISYAEKLPGIRISGVGTNMGCYGGILPTLRNLTTLCHVTEKIEKNTGRKIEIISGGGTSSLTLTDRNEMPEGVNQLRVGEGILLGTDTTHQEGISWLHQDAFVLRAEIVEVRSKPSVPYGEVGRDAFGRIPEFEDHGIRKRAILALGKQDVLPEGIFPLEKGIRILGSSSDHMILDVEDAEREFRVGDQISFGLRYSGLLTLCTSRYIRKVFMERKEKEIYMAGGCFWGLEAYMEQIEGVLSAESGYANGKTEETRYEEIRYTDHAETVHLVYDPDKISLRELLSYYLRVVDPTSINRQGNDRGRQYRTGIYYTDEEDRAVIRKRLEEEALCYEEPVVIEVEPIRNFVRAEEYHQKYLQKNPGGYCHIDLKRAEEPLVDRALYPKIPTEELRQTLTDLQYAVTQQGATEQAFSNVYWNHFERGIYVDIATGEPLFVSSDKFESGCGWPSFSKPVSSDVIRYYRDNSYGMQRIEVKSSSGNSHLGHVFEDGPEERGGLRYCINSASLRFVPYDRMEAEGYGYLMAAVEDKERF